MKIQGVVCLAFFDGKNNEILQADTTKQQTEGDVLFALGEGLYKANKYDSSIAVLKNALKQFEKEKNPERQMMSLIVLGRNYTAKEIYQDAIEYLNKAVKLGKKHLGEIHFNMAQAYNSLGIVYRRMGEYDQSISIYNKSLNVRLKLFGDIHSEVGKVYGNLGIVYWNKGDYEKAFEYMNKGYSIEQKTLPPDDAQIGNTLNNIGLVLWNMGDHAKALEYFFKDVEIELKKKGEESPDLANPYSNIAVIYHETGEYEKAIEFQTKSLRIRLKVFGEKHPTVSINYLNLGKVYQSMHNLERALEYQRKSMAIRLAVYDSLHPLLSKGYTTIGEVFSDLQQYDSAIFCFNKALAINQAKLDAHHPETGEIYIGLGNASLRLKKFDEAIEYFQSAIATVVPSFKPTSFPENPALENIRSEVVLLSALEAKAKAFEVRAAAYQPFPGDLSASFQTYSLASDLIDRMNRRYSAEYSKLNLTQKYSRVDEGAVRTAMQLFEETKNASYREKALRFAEKSKARLLLEAMNDSKAKQFAGLPDSVLRKEYQFKVDLSSLEKNLNEEGVKGKKADQKKITQWRSRLFSLKRMYESHINHLEKKYPEYYSLKYQARTATVQELQQKLLGTNDVLIEYVAGESALAIFVVTKHSLTAVSVPVDAMLETSIRQFREGITNRQFIQYTKNAFTLYNYLLRPVQASITGKNLIIVPDGMLHLIPFEALLTAEVNRSDNSYADLPYLLRDHSVSYAPSATLLLELKNKKQPPTPKQYLAVAPNYESENEETVNRFVSGKQRTFPALPFAEREVKETFALFDTRPFLEKLWSSEKTAKAVAFIGSDATEKNFKSADIWNYRYVHFASHVVVNTEQPELSAIVFTEEKNANEDGFLYTGEIYNLTFRADVIALSGCETGLGKIMNGEGMLGLTRAFLYAGASNLLVSLWQVNDESTSGLMVECFRGMIQKQSNSAALRAAKLRMISSEQTSAPMNWASFVLIGK
ncbi:MAG: CHAT domain-containing protein [Ignavibacteriae bacterium]|nr:CHAT domain-containing protein [Ignavibacteriota bacterium]